MRDFTNGMSSLNFIHWNSKIWNSLQNQIVDRTPITKEESSKKLDYILFTPSSKSWVMFLIRKKIQKCKR